MADDAALRAELDDLRRDMADLKRLASYAEEDRKRLAVTVREDSVRGAEEGAKAAIKDAFNRINVDIDKPEPFNARLRWLAELMDAVGSAKKTAMGVAILTIVGGLMAFVWKGFLGGIKP